MMVRGVMTRLLSATGALAVAAALIVGATPVAASAAPKAAAPKINAISITGKDIPALKVNADERADVFDLLLSEVSWLAKATPQTSAPKSKQLGPKYTLSVLAKDKPQQVYDLYPLAVGGPRAYRPAKQPTGKVQDGWFYGRLTMSESLRSGGVPLEARNDVMNGGIGGGIPEEVQAKEIDPVENVNAFLTQMRQLFLLNGAVLVVILFGLAGMAFLIRRRV
jgi:hypothetical protein